MTHLAIFASGKGSNAQRIIQYFQHHPSIVVSIIVCNKPGAGVLAVAHQAGIPSLLIERERFFRGDGYVGLLQQHHIDYIILAGFLWKVPGSIVQQWRGNILNIHPALLPNYGGKGMYGEHVHAAVIAAGDRESGITIHYVDEWYDHGHIIFQASCPVLPTDSVASLAERIHQLEHAHYPRVIEEVIESAKIKLNEPAGQGQS